MMNDETKKDMFSFILSKVGAENIGQVVFEQNNTIYVSGKQHSQMPAYLTRERAVEIYNFLIENSFIISSTPVDSFLYLMGVSGVEPKKLTLIDWIGTQQQLRTMLSLAFENQIKRSALRLAEIERLCPLCFLVKGKKINVLAKPYKEMSLEMDKLKDFFRPKSNTI